MTVALGTAGYLPTAQLGGQSAAIGMLTGCLISLIASGVGGLVVALTQPVTPAQAANIVLGATVVRFFVAGILAVATALTGKVAPAAMLIWVAISYAGLLIVDTWFAVSETRIRTLNSSGG